MNGASVIVEDQAARAALARLVEIGASRKALKWIGVEVAKQVRHRIGAGGPAPDGSPWRALNPLYAKDKKGPGLLRELGMRGGLQGSITWAVEGDSVRIGSNKVYAAMHQFGGTIVPKNAKALVFRLGGELIFASHVTIPARPYLGLSAADRRDLEELLVFQLRRLLDAA